MAFISTIRPGDACGSVHDMYARQERHWGYVPDYAKIFSHRPEVMARWGRLLAEIRRPVDDRRFELVTFAVAAALRNSPCALEHGRQLAGIIGEHAVLAIAKGAEAEVLPSDEAAIVRFARAIAEDAGQITEGRVAALKKVHGLADDEIFDIVAIAAARCFFTRILDALGSEPDVGFMALSPALRQALTLGRPISQRAPEYTHGTARAGGDAAGKPGRKSPGGAIPARAAEA